MLDCEGHWLDPPRSHYDTLRRYTSSGSNIAAQLPQVHHRLGCGAELHCVLADSSAGGGRCAASGKITTVSDHVLVYHGPINVGIVRDGDRALVIDCGDESVSDALGQLGISRVEQLLFTHYHRDQSCGATKFMSTATIGVPTEERDLFANPGKYWSDDNQLYRVYQSFRPDHLTPAEPLPVARRWRTAIDSSSDPQLSRSSRLQAIQMARLVSWSKRTASGPCSAEIAWRVPGKVWDMYSLQRGFRAGRPGDRRISRLHG